MYHLFHFRKHKADKFLQFYEKGKVKPDSICERNRGIDKDFEELTAKLKDMVSTLVVRWSNNGLVVALSVSAEYSLHVHTC